MSFENITFIYRAFQIWAWPLLDKRSTSKTLTDSIYKLVKSCVGQVVLLNNPIVFRSHLIFDSAQTNQSTKLRLREPVKIIDNPRKLDPQIYIFPNITTFSYIVH